MPEDILKQLFGIGVHISSLEWTKEGANYLEEQIQKVMNSLESWIGF
jgi:N-acetyl-anhydromuramyl-L-alanine amidase AmpD